MRTSVVGFHAKANLYSSLNKRDDILFTITAVVGGNAAVSQLSETFKTGAFVAAYWTIASSHTVKKQSSPQFRRTKRDA